MPLALIAKFLIPGHYTYGYNGGGSTEGRRVVNETIKAFYLRVCDYNSFADSRKRINERYSLARPETDSAVNKDVPRYFCPAILRPFPPSVETRRLFYYTLRKHREHKRTTRVPPERNSLSLSLFLQPPVHVAVYSENALLFHHDKKFNGWIITSDLIDRQAGMKGVERRRERE